MLDLPSIVRRFDVEHVPIGGPVFDVAKLDWLNARYIRERLDAASLIERVRRLGRLARSSRSHRAARGAPDRASQRPRAVARLSLLGTARAACRGLAEQEARCGRDARGALARARRARGAARLERAVDRVGDDRPLRSALERRCATSRARSTLRSPEARPRFHSTIRWSCSVATSCASGFASHSQRSNARERRRDSRNRAGGGQRHPHEKRRAPKCCTKSAAGRCSGTYCARCAARAWTRSSS